MNLYNLYLFLKNYVADKHLEVNYIRITKHVETFATDK